jgi:hypothetical protein
MSKSKNKSASGAMLDLWRPPPSAGDPVGCLATTYTFAPALFDEQCLARFLEIESEPNREDLAFLLERESRLGSVYAGVLVDFTQAGVEHSLRWDVLPVRVRAGKQHGKISLLSWSRHVRVIVASANLTEAGYRSNYEVAASVDLTPASADLAILTEAIAFLRSLLLLVPGAAENSPEVGRAKAFLEQVTRQTSNWKSVRRGTTVRQHLVFTLPAADKHAARSALEEVVQACRVRGGSPHEARIASPFFDVEEVTSRVTAALCKLMARGTKRNLTFCVPAVRSEIETAAPRLAAPKALLLTPPAYQGAVKVHILPEADREKNRRPWHAKLLAVRADRYAALMIGSSNFTCAGMGVGPHRNAEANLLSIVDRVDYGREIGQLDAVWPDTESIADPEGAEWLGAQPDREEEEQATAWPLPAGFISATYCAGDKRQIILRLATEDLPESWSVHACGQEVIELMSAAAWRAIDCPATVEIDWAPVQPPEKLLIRWNDREAFLTLNVQDSRALPPPAQLEQMSADDMLLILAAADPSAAFRAWAKRQQPPDLFDTDLDSAMPIDLDPLRRYDLQTTFLHRIRRRARILAQLRSNLERPVWGPLALEWRLRGLVGIEPLAQRLVREFTAANGAADEALLTLADFLIVLRETEYKPGEGALPKSEFDKVYRSFLSELADRLRGETDPHRDRISEELMQFWERVLEQCQE